MATSPSGTVFAGGRADGTVRVWSSEGEELVCKGLTRELSFNRTGTAIALPGDDAYIAAATYGEVRFWQTSAPKELARLNYGKRVNAIALAPNGRLIAAAVGPVVQISPWRAEDLADCARRLLTRGLSAEERKRYIERERDAYG